MNKRGAKLVLNKLILIVILIFVLVLVIIVLARFGYAGKINDLLPDFLRDDVVIIQDEDCPDGASFIGIVDEKNYIHVNGIRTPVYINYKDEKVYLDDNSISSDIALGSYMKQISRIMIHDDYQNRKSNKYVSAIEKGIPDADVLKLMHLSQRNPKNDYLCKKDEYMFTDIKCVESCSDYMGECLENSENLISLGGLDCENNKRCFVDSTYKSQSSDSISLNKFEMLFLNDKDIVNDLKNINEIKMNYGVKSISKLDFEVESTKRMCYTLRASFDELVKGSSSNEGVIEEVVNRGSMWIPNHKDKVIILRVWDANNPNDALMIKIPVKLILPRNYRDGVILSQDSMAWLRTHFNEYKIGTDFYIFGVQHYWDNKDSYENSGYSYSYYPAMPVAPTSISQREMLSRMWDSKGSSLLREFKDYKITKVSDSKIKISVFNYPPDNNKWHVLDCYRDFLAIPLISSDEKSFDISELRNYFKENLIKYCSW